MQDTAPKNTSFLEHFLLIEKYENINTKYDFDLMFIVDCGDFDRIGEVKNLVKNGFFMPNSTIGEFAKSKIEEVIEIINASKYHENKEFCDYIISIVGEPLIKNKLLSMIEEQESIQDKINRRKKEIEELEKELKKNDKN